MCIEYMCVRKHTAVSVEQASSSLAASAAVTDMHVWTHVHYIWVYKHIAALAEQAPDSVAVSLYISSKY